MVLLLTGTGMLSKAAKRTKMDPSTRKLIHCFVIFVDVYFKAWFFVVFSRVC